jgi:hypothetical protein
MVKQVIWETHTSSLVNKCIVSVLSIGAIFSIATQAQAQNIVTNGDFSGGTAAGWTVAVGSFNANTPPGGVEFGASNTPSRVYQDLTTVIGNTYNFSFNFGTYRPSSATSPWNFDVVFGNGATAFQTVTFNAFDPAQTLDYATGLIGVTTFNATSTSTRLSFDTTPYAHGWVTLDNISVVSAGAAAPEPTTLALLAFGGLGSAMITRRRLRS